MKQTSPAKVKAKQITQVAFVVKDLQKTMENYWNVLGIGPWDVYEMHAPALSNMTYRGKPADFSMKVGNAMVGSIELQLIQPLSGESLYREALAEQGERVHHLQFITDNLDKVTQIMNQDGFATLESANVNDGKFAYFDMVDALKCIWEVFQPPTEMKPTYRWPE